MRRELRNCKEQQNSNKKFQPQPKKQNRPTTSITYGKNTQNDFKTQEFNELKSQN